MNNIDIPGNYKKVVRYFWDPEPKNDLEPGSSIWCLGREYPPSTPSLSTPDLTNNTETPSTTEDQKPTQKSRPGSIDSDWVKAEAPQHAWPPGFLDDFGSIMWLTYRSNFPAIPKSTDPKATSGMSFGVRLRSQLVESEGFTSDTGWGCMIRSGQSLLANALSILSLGRDWRRGGSNDEDEKRLLSLFADDPRAPFSIHRFVEHGASACGKHPGQWFGPSATARCIEALSSECKDAGLNVYVTSDGSNVYEDRFRDIARGGTDSIHPTLILLGIRLGIDRITPIYWDALKEALKYPQSVGIAGGRPSSSHYFVGVQGSHFFYLDPHHTRPALPYHDASSSLSFTDEELDSYHTRRLRRLHISEMDPSMLVGFLIRSEEDWSAWKQSVQSPPGGKPIFHIFDSESAAFGPGFERAGAVDEVEALDDFHCDNGNGNGE